VEDAMNDNYPPPTGLVNAEQCFQFLSHIARLSVDYLILSADKVHEHLHVRAL
jgi:hypothetical protein